MILYIYRKSQNESKGILKTYTYSSSNKTNKNLLQRIAGPVPRTAVDCGGPQITNYCTYIHIYKCVFLAHRHFFLFRPRVFSRVLGSVARREPVRTPRASLGPGRGPQHVLWGLEVASPGEGFRARRDMHVHANPRTG